MNGKASKRIRRVSAKTGESTLTLKRRYKATPRNKRRALLDLWDDRPDAEKPRSEESWPSDVYVEMTKLLMTPEGRKANAEIYEASDVSSELYGNEKTEEDTDDRPDAEKPQGEGPGA